MEETRMKNDNSDTDGLGGRALTDDELMQIHGGNIFGDAWNAVKGYANDVVDAIKYAVDVLAHPFDHLPRIPNLPSPTIPKPHPLPKR
jgi:hypothetical protein